MFLQGMQQEVLGECRDGIEGCTRKVTSNAEQDIEERRYKDARNDETVEHVEHAVLLAGAPN